MTYTKKIICLANSIKLGGKCIAGKEYKKDHNGEWIRPVSSRPTQEINEEERRFENGVCPEVLDIITIRMLKHIPHAHQQENHLIDDKCPWGKIGSIKSYECANLLDSLENELWINGYNSFNGINDRIPLGLCDKLTNSLLLVQPDKLMICVQPERSGRKVRACFSLNNHEYKLIITDPKVENGYLQKEDGEYDLDPNNIYMCVSVAEKYYGYCYKLVASIINGKLQ